MMNNNELQNKYQKILLKLLKISLEILSEDDIDKQLKIIADSISELGFFRRSMISLLDKNWKILKISYSGVAEEFIKNKINKEYLNRELREKIFVEKYKISNSYFIPYEKALEDKLNEIEKNEDINIINSYMKKEDFVDWHPEDMLIIPLYGRNKEIIGVVSVDDPYNGMRPSKEYLEILEIFANQAAIAIEKNLIYWQLYQKDIFLKNFIDYTSHIVIETDKENKIILCNKECEKVLGYKTEELIGTNINKIIIDEKIIEEIDTFFVNDKNENNKNQVIKIDTKIKRVDGSELPVTLSTSVLINDIGDIIGIEYIFFDLTDIFVMKQKMMMIEIAAGLSHEINNVLSTLIITMDSIKKSDELVKIKEILLEQNLSNTYNLFSEKFFILENNIKKISDIIKKLELTILQGKYDKQVYANKTFMADFSIIDKQLEDKRIYETERLENNFQDSILIIDDNYDLLMEVKKYLECKNYYVDIAEDGQKGLEKFISRKDCYKVVVTDIKMPNMNGYDLAMNIKKISPKTKMIFITAFGYDPDHTLQKINRDITEKDFETTAFKVLHKPFTLDKLEKIIEKAMKNE